MSKLSKEQLKALKDVLIKAQDIVMGAEGTHEEIDELATDLNRALNRLDSKCLKEIGLCLDHTGIYREIKER